MNSTHKIPLIGLALCLSIFGTSPALAEKPEWAGEKNGKHEKRDKRERERERDDRHETRRHDESRNGPSISIGIHFGDRERVTVREYYRESFSRNDCPPGLAKKNNGCLPPGLAKKWKRGSPLPRDVVYYDLPPELVIRLGTPPSGHRYVRVAGDILLIAVGTAMVVDAIEDLSRM